MRLVVLLFVLSASFLHAQDSSSPQKTISIFFGGGSYYIDAQERAKLQKWINDIPGVEQYIMEIHGHTDDIGSREYNLWLSQNRTQSVASLLQRLGIDSTGMTIMDFGEEAPVFDNATWEGKLNNRRVDIILKRIDI